MRVPDWVDEGRVEELARQVAEKVAASAEQSADEARKFFGIDKMSEEIAVPEHLEKLISKMRGKRVW